MVSLVKLENVALGKVSQLEFVSSKVKFTRNPLDVWRIQAPDSSSG